MRTPYTLHFQHQCWILSWVEYFWGLVWIIWHGCESSSDIERFLQMDVRTRSKSNCRSLPEPSSSLLNLINVSIKEDLVQFTEFKGMRNADMLSKEYCSERTRMTCEQAAWPSLDDRYWYPQLIKLSVVSAPLYFFRRYITPRLVILSGYNANLKLLVIIPQMNVLIQRLLVAASEQCVRVHMLVSQMFHRGVWLGNSAIYMRVLLMSRYLLNNNMQQTENRKQSQWPCLLTSTHFDLGIIKG